MRKTHLAALAAALLVTVPVTPATASPQTLATGKQVVDIIASSFPHANCGEINQTMKGVGVAATTTPDKALEIFVDFYMTQLASENPGLYTDAETLTLKNYATKEFAPAVTRAADCGYFRTHTPDPQPEPKPAPKPEPKPGPKPEPDRQPTPSPAGNPTPADEKKDRSDHEIPPQLALFELFFGSSGLSG